ncbi:hypothetical protein [Halosimplex pelagicum]|uniref:Uncharacterized protein n=1 Tax=Halosimplex pelagicum TaxID=869886 RepID=A0A7D5P9T2_9EURY|nr:hypothetical protein [Halosimplex pelagicum]QLH80962.1 hypothetical protein HZS54_04625 [Halosimplex pelagicum]
MSTDETRADRKERYERVLSTVAHNTGGVQHPGCRPYQIRLILCAHANLPVDGVERSIRAAVENDDLYKWRDSSGHTRLTLATKPDLRNVAEYWAGRGDQRRLEAANQAIERVWGEHGPPGKR